MRTCPNCGEKIHDNTKKCNFCGEYLYEKNKSTQNVISGFWRKFFREDLNLNKKWWHRLIKTIFIILIIFMFLYGIFTSQQSKIEDKNYIYVEVIDKVENRIGDNVIKIGDILNKGEYIQEGHSLNKGDIVTHLFIFSGFTQKFTDGHDELLEKYTYCSKSWDTEKLSTLANKTNLWYDSRFGGSRESRFDSSLENPLLEQVNYEIDNFKCVIYDSYDSKKFLNHKFAKLENLYIVKQTEKSQNKENLWNIELFLIDCLIQLSETAIIALILIFIYYKIIIYIIYGSHKKNSSV